MRRRNARAKQGPGVFPASSVGHDAERRFAASDAIPIGSGLRNAPYALPYLTRVLAGWRPACRQLDRKPVECVRDERTVARASSGA